MGKRKTKKKGNFLVGFLLKVGIIALIIFLVLHFVIAIYRVDDNNMFPMMKDGDFCILYKLDDYYMNNVILYKTDQGNKLGRIVAIGGQEVDFPEEGGFLVNGYMPSEEIMYQTFKAEESPVNYPIYVDEGSYFVMNDFRSDTKDSRQFGLVKKEDIIGKMLFILRRRSF